MFKFIKGNDLRTRALSIVFWAMVPCVVYPASSWLGFSVLPPLFGEYVGVALALGIPVVLLLIASAPFVYLLSLRDM